MSSESSSVVSFSVFGVHFESVVVTLGDITRIVVTLFVVATIVCDGTVPPGAVQPQMPLVSRPYDNRVSVLEEQVLAYLGEIDLKLLLCAAAKERATCLSVAVSSYGALNCLALIVAKVQRNDCTYNTRK